MAVRACFDFVVALSDGLTRFICYTVGNGVVHENGSVDDEFQPLPPPQKDEDDEKGKKKKTDAVGILELFSFADKWDVFWICLG